MAGSCGAGAHFCSLVTVTFSSPDALCEYVKVDAAQSLQRKVKGYGNR